MLANKERTRADTSDVGKTWETFSPFHDLPKPFRITLLVRPGDSS